MENKEMALFLEVTTDQGTKAINFDLVECLSPFNSGTAIDVHGAEHTILCKETVSDILLRLEERHIEIAAKVWRRTEGKSD